MCIYLHTLCFWKAVLKHVPDSHSGFMWYVLQSSMPCVFRGCRRNSGIGYLEAEYCILLYRLHNLQHTMRNSLSGTHTSVQCIHAVKEIWQHKAVVSLYGSTRFQCQLVFNAEVFCYWFPMQFYMGFRAQQEKFPSTKKLRKSSAGTRHHVFVDM